MVAHAFHWEGGQLTDLGALPANPPQGRQQRCLTCEWSSFVNWIDATGTAAVGFSQTGAVDPLTGQPQQLATLWDRQRITNLGTLGGDNSLATSVNKRGQVTGAALNDIADPLANLMGGFYFLPAATQVRAFLWENGVMNDLGTLGTGTNRLGQEINEAGEVAGISATDQTPHTATGGLPTIHPFLWRCGKMIDLGDLGGAFGISNALNNRGEVVGQMNLTGDQNQHAFLWHDGVLTDLQTLGGANSAASWINDFGEVVGRADFSISSHAHHAFLWRNGSMKDLGTPDGDQCSTAFYINLQGQVVGQSVVTCGGEVSHGWLWEKGGPIVDLNKLLLPGSDLSITNATNINERGEGLGQAQTLSGDVHAVLLIPCDRNHASMDGCENHLDEMVTDTTHQAPTTAMPQSGIQGSGSRKNTPQDWRTRSGRRFPGFDR